MNVNIVSPWAIEHDHVLRRRARLLSMELDWPISSAPSRGSINYFIPYHCWQSGGETVALFTHDMGHPAWNRAAAGATLRISLSPLHLDELAAHGATEWIPVGVDTAHFTPGDRGSGVGVAGINYGDGRKGEDLVQRLIEEGVELRISGRGFQGARWLAWEEMPDFYRSLGVYLCTSRVEGGPCGPLEALACGVPIVIPRNVGIMDELPAMPGIHHYRVGDYNDMRRALEEAQQATFEKDALRTVALRFSYEAWVENHRRVFEEFLS